MRDDVCRDAARSGVRGWFGRLLVLFNELPHVWGPDDVPQPLSEIERHAVLADLVRRAGASVFGVVGADAWVPQLDRIIGELVREGVAPSDFAAAVSEDIETAGTRDPFHARRARELVGIYDEWHSVLRTAARSDGRDARVRLARFIREHPERFEERLDGVRNIRIVGLADLRGAWRQLLSALAECDALESVEVVTSTELDLPPGVLSVREFVDADGGSTSLLPGHLSIAAGSDTSAGEHRLNLIHAPDVSREIELVAARVRALVERGVAPDSIAVVARQARPMVNQMAAALQICGVPVTARTRMRLSHSTPARALVTLLAAAAESWARFRVQELAEHPLLSSGLDPVVIDAVGFARPITALGEWEEALAELLRRSHRSVSSEGDGVRYGATLPPVPQIEATLTAWRGILPLCTDLERPRPLTEWLEWVNHTLTDDGWGVPERLEAGIVDAEVRTRDFTAHSRICAVVRSWRKALAQFHASDAEMSPGDFLEYLRLLLEQDHVSAPATDYGVQVLEAHAAAWRSFDHVFVIGLTAGEFPLRPESDILLSRGYRRELRARGLPLHDPDSWRVEERELFRTICHGARSALTFSWSASGSDGYPVTRSAFVEEVVDEIAASRGVPGDDVELAALGVLQVHPPHESLVSGFPVAIRDEDIEHGRRAAEREDARSRSPSPHNGAVERSTIADWLKEHYGADYVWSATQLEKVAKCHWHWFAERLLALEESKELTDLVEPTVIGAIQHEALNRFFATARERAGGVAYLTPVDDEWAMSAIEEAVDAAWDAAGQRGDWLGSDAIGAIIRSELLRELQEYLRFEMHLHTKSENKRTAESKQIRMGAESGELRFDDVLVKLGGESIRMRGIIDRVDRGIDERVSGAERFVAAIDYKRTAASTPAGGDRKGWDDGVVLQLPLYAAVLRQLYPDSEVARLEYRTVAKPSVRHRVALWSLVKDETVRNTADEERLAGALQAAGRYVKDVRSGILPAAPAESCGCPPFCVARDICRIPGGPVDKW